MPRNPRNGYVPHHLVNVIPGWVFQNLSQPLSFCLCSGQHGLWLFLVTRRNANLVSFLQKNDLKARAASCQWRPNSKADTQTDGQPVCSWCACADQSEVFFKIDLHEITAMCLLTKCLNICQCSLTFYKMYFDVMSLLILWRRKWLIDFY